MIQAPGKTRQKILKKASIFALILLIISITALPALGNDDDETNFIIPDYGYTVDYYRSHGEPVLQVSVTGDPEFNRGETADLQIKIANRGVINGFQRLNVNQVGISNSAEEVLAISEMEEEKECTTAKNINAFLASGTDYIKIESKTNFQNLEELETGHTANLKYTIRIDSDTPAGDYELLLPVSYDYQANVRTATGAVINLGLTDLDYTREYKTKEETLRIPISIKSRPKLEVTEVSGSLKQGEKRAIEVTYTNTRESVAQDAMARIIIMSPLSTEKSIVRLGDIGPGENRTARFEIAASSDATVKNYGIDSEIKYVDEEGETSFSNNLKVHVPLEATEKKISTAGIAVILIILIALYQIVNVHRKRKKNDEIDENASGDENE